MAYAILNKMASPEIRITVKVIDNNANPEKGYDIESIKPGDTRLLLSPDSPFFRYFNGPDGQQREPAAAGQPAAPAPAARP